MRKKVVIVLLVFFLLGTSACVANLAKLQNAPGQAGEKYLAPELDWKEVRSNIPIYGLTSVILSRTSELNAEINEILAMLEYKSENVICSRADEFIMSSLENDPRFAKIKEKTNQIYSFYDLEGKIGEAYGRYTQQMAEHFVDYVIFDEEPEDTFFFISGTENHMPRPVTVYVNYLLNKETGCYEYQKMREFNEKRLLQIGSYLIGDERDVSIAQYLECDLNNDGKMEKIVNYNNFLIDPYVDHYLIGGQEFNWQEKYYSILVILDENYLPLGFVQNMPDFVGLDNLHAYEIGQTLLEYIVDLDQDGEMEMLSIKYGWEYDDYIFTKLIPGQVENYFRRYYSIFY